MIRLLYRASDAGVHVRLIIRGITCIIPGKKELSENIEAISIVDRYLEHARVFIFHNGGKEKIFCSSSGYEERNLSFRIETAFPIYDEEIREQIFIPHGSAVAG
jgi:polyphosphate kinase